MRSRPEKVAVISGGRSSEHDVSLRSGKSVADGLRAAGFGVVEVEIDRQGIWTQGGRLITLEPAGGLRGVDVVFPVLHGPFGEDGTIQGVLEVLDVPYVGSGVLGSALCMDKLTLKRLLAARGVPQVNFVEVGEPGWRERIASFDLPLWVKPSRLGSSVGIRPVGGIGAELNAAIADAAAHDPRVIIEAASNGAEVECSVLGDPDFELPDSVGPGSSAEAIGSLIVSAPGQIVIDAEWYDYEAKYSEGAMRLRIPAEISDQSATELRRTAAEVFALAGCHGLARCDFFVEEDGRVLLSEINTMPGFTTTSVYSKLLEAIGISYPDLCAALVDLALERHRRQAALRY